MGRLRLARPLAMFALIENHEGGKARTGKTQSIHSLFQKRVLRGRLRGRLRVLIIHDFTYVPRVFAALKYSHMKQRNCKQTYTCTPVKI
jgi:hypothetical protein